MSTPDTVGTPIMRLDCDTFAELLGDHLEGDAPESARAAVEAHAASCERCAALLADLAAISRDAAALPALTPSRDLWSGIADRIAAPVASLDAARDTATVLPMRRRWARPAVAAAALMLVTAGVTHWATRASLEGAGAAAIGALASVPEPVVQVATTAPDTAPIAGMSAGRSVGPAVTAPATTAPARNSERGVPTYRLAAAPTYRSPATPATPARAIDPIYATEIAKLRGIVRERRDQLDPATIAVLEHSISVIDAAIAQSRAALAKDPASGFLASQLNQSLEKKVELLRTAALLPART